MMKRPKPFTTAAAVVALIALNGTFPSGRCPAGGGAITGDGLKVVVKWDGKVIPGIARVSALRRTTEVLVHRSGGDPSMSRKSPGRSDYPPLVLERERTTDTAFEEWANKTWNFGAGLGTESSLKDFRKDVIIEFYDSDGNLTSRFLVFRCWPSEYAPMGDYGAGDPASGMETLVLQYEGWERDYSAGAP